MSIRQDMGSVEQFVMSQSADRARSLISLNDAHTKTLLMQSSLGGNRHIGTLCLRIRCDPGVRVFGNSDAGLFAHFHREAEGRGIITDDVCGPNGGITSSYDSIEIDQGYLPLHTGPQTRIVPVLRIGASVAVANQPVLPNF